MIRLGYVRSTKHLDSQMMEGLVEWTKPFSWSITWIIAGMWQSSSAPAMELLILASSWGR